MRLHHRATPHVVLLVTAIVSACVLVVVLDAAATERLADEDGPIEYLAALGFLVASAAFLLAGLRWRRDPGVPRLVVVAVLGLAAVFLLGAGEEVSWGQRLFGVETPESVAAINAQGELTLHNLTAFQGDEALLHNGFDKAFDLFWVTWAVLVPLAFAFVPATRRLLTRVTPVLPWWYAALFVATYGLSKLGGQVARRIDGASFSVHDVVETKEALFALLFTSAALWLWQHGPVPALRDRVRTADVAPSAASPTEPVTGAESGW
jgi:energy-coupling factor transporter transmembrane protein EcfT